ncbi:MAG: glycosyltransferase family 87 protein [Afipia sp.]
MAHFWLALGSELRSGAWLTPSRMRTYALIVLGISLAGLVGWVAMSDHMIDRNGKPIGTDFASFYAAGSLARDGRAADVYDMAAHYARQQQIFGAGVPHYGWLYPPLFLLIATPLALMPYPAALAAWQGGTLLLYLAVIGMIVHGFRDAQARVGKIWILLALAFPAVFVNLGHGQNGFLSAALFGGALVALPKRPVIAGMLFGMLAYKPQFALVIPIALLVAGQWRAILAAGLTVAILCGVTALLFGIDIWFAFAASMETSRKLLLEQGDVGFEKLQSIFAAVRMWGGSVPLAYAVQTTLSIVVVGSAAWIWRAQLDHAVKAAVLVIATLLASPHVLDYDLTILGIAIAFLATTGLMRGFRPYEITLLAAAWIVPLVSRGIAGATGVPLGLLAMIALYAIVLRRASSDLEGLTARTHEFAKA